MNDTVEPVPKKRRWLRRTLIAAAAMLVLVGLLPTFGSGFVASWVESNFAASHMGRLGVSGLSLGWFSRQRVDEVRLLEPDGADVAVMSVELPSLSGILFGGGNAYGRVQVRGSVDLVAADDGTTNLDRALASRATVGAPAPLPPAGESVDLGELLRRLELELEIDLERITWSDARTRAAGRPIAIEAFASRAIARPGEPLRVTASGTIVGAKPGRLQLAATLYDLFDGQEISDRARGDFDVAIDALPSALVDSLAQQDGVMVAAFGPEFRIAAKGEGALEAGELRLEVIGERGSVHCNGRIEKGVLRGSEASALRVRLRPEAAPLERLLARLAPGLAFTPVGEAELDVAITDLRVEVASILAALNAGRDLGASVVAASELSLQLTGGGWNVTGDAVAFEGGVAVLSPQLTVRLIAAEAAPRFEVQLGGQLGGGLSGSFAAQVHCDDLAAMLAHDPNELVASLAGTEPRFDATLAVQQFDPAVLMRFAPADVPVVELLGGNADLRIEVGNRGESREATLRLAAPNLELSLAGWLNGGEFVGSATRDGRIELRVGTAAWTDLLARYLPAGVGATIGESMSVRLDRSLRVPVTALADAEDPLAVLLQRAELHADVALDRCTVATPELSAANQAFALREVVLSVFLSHAPDVPPLRGSLTGKIGAIAGQENGTVAVRASMPDTTALLDRAEGAPLPPIAIEGDFTALPTALIDTIAAQDGLLVDTLGPEVNLTLRGRQPDPKDPLRIELKSNTATITLVARLDGRTLQAEGDLGLDASLPLTPLFSKRIVGSLVPLLVQAQKPAGAAPVGLSVRAFRLPLDADLRRLSGTVELDLGDVAYQLLPGLGDYLTAAGLGNVATATARLPKLTIPIRDGVAGYDSLPVTIDGRSYVFKGSFDLATAEMDFATELPLSIVGKKLSKELEKARKYLDPQMLVPIELKGSWSKPRLVVGGKFLRGIAESALKRGLLDLFRKKDK